jgi:phage gp29-like protein
MSIELAQPRKRKTVTKPDTREISVVSIFDRYGTYPSQGLTPQRLTGIFKEADQGDILRQSELFEEMLEKDPRLFGMFHSRRNAVMKFDYQIQPSIGDDAKYKMHAEYVKTVFDNIKDLRGAKENILDAVPKALSTLWIGWQIEGNDVWIDKLNWVHQKNFRFGIASDPKSDMNELRLLTDNDSVNGIPLDPNKWIVALMKARSGHPARTSILRTCAWMYLFKNFDVKAWIQFAEIFGMPLRVGKYKQMAGEEEKKALLQALQNLAQDASAMISDNTSIEFVEAVQKAATAAIHSELAAFCNDENSIAVLGHTGGAQSTPGKLGGEDAAMEVREDLVESDTLSLDYILTDQVVVPLINFKFGPQKSYPYHKTIMPKPVNRKEEAEVLAIAVNDVGMAIPKKHAYDKLGIPEPQNGEEVILPRPQATNIPFGGSTLYHVMAGTDKKKVPPQE